MRLDSSALILLISAITVPVSMTLVRTAPSVFFAISVAWLISPALFLKSETPFKLCVANSLLYLSIYVRSIVFSLSSAADPSGLFGYHLQEAAALVVVLYLVYRLLGLNWVGLNRRAFGKGLLVGLAIGLPFGVLDKLSGETSLTLPSGWWAAFAWVLSLSAIVALLEEVTFRGILYRSARGRFGFWLASVYQSLIFASVHYPNPLTAIVAAFLFAMIMSTLVEKTGSLSGAIVAHWANNCVWMLLGW